MARQRVSELRVEIAKGIDTVCARYGYEKVTYAEICMALTEVNSHHQNLQLMAETPQPEHHEANESEEDFDSRIDAIHGAGAADALAKAIEDGSIFGGEDAETE